MTFTTIYCLLFDYDVLFHWYICDVGMYLSIGMADAST